MDPGGKIPFQTNGIGSEWTEAGKVVGPVGPIDTNHWYAANKQNRRLSVR